MLANKNFVTPGILSRAGVKVAITTDSPVTPLHTLPLMAGMAVAAGMDFNEALRAITLNAGGNYRNRRSSGEYCRR